MKQSARKMREYADGLEREMKVRRIIKKIGKGEIERVDGMERINKIRKGGTKTGVR